MVILYNLYATIQLRLCVHNLPIYLTNKHLSLNLEQNKIRLYKMKLKKHGSLKTNMLVILDIDLFFYKTPKIIRINSKKVIRTFKNDFNIYIRPNIKEFLDWLFNTYEVAFFSSYNFYIVKEILDMILSYKQQKKLVFNWTRDKCNLDPEYGYIEGIYAQSTVKLLDTILYNPIINKKRDYNKYNIIFIDVSYLHMRYNPKESFIISPSYYKNREDHEELCRVKKMIKMRSLFLKK